MKFSAEMLSKYKQTAVLKTGPKAVTSLLQSPEGKSIVVKKFNPEFAGEARTEYLFLQAVKGENIVKALDFVASEQPVIVMEYIDGSPLDKDTFKTTKELEQCFAGLAQTLAVIHNYGICLNDIKPENIIIKDNTAYLTDFGLATVNLFFERNFRGTPAFAAPEKFLHQTNHFAADVFSLGMTMFFLKNDKTVFDITGEEEYKHLVSREELWQKQIEVLESDALIRSMLCYDPLKRPQAIEAALILAERNKLKLESADKTIIDSHVFKVQMAGVEKLWKRKSLCCDYTDEPKVMENLLSLWAESEGKKLLILDEGFFITQPEEFFRSFPFGYREKNIYQPHFIEWLEEQPLAILLRRNKEMNPTSFFDEIQKRTNAMQIWIGSESDIRPVGIQEIQDLMLQLPDLNVEKNNLRKLIKSAKPFYVRLLLLGFLTAQKPLLAQNELTEFLAWIKVSLPLTLVEKIWENWHILMQDGLLNRKIIFESNSIRCDAKNDCSGTPAPELVQMVLDSALKAGLNNIAGEIHYLTGENDQALQSWTGYVDDLIKKEYFLSAYEFIGQLRKRIKTLSFDLRKKEAFLARICGHFELSNRMYEDLIAASEGLLKAVLSVDRAIVLQALKRNDEAIDSYRNAIELFRIHKDQKSLFRAMNNLGVVYFGLQKYTEAEQIFNDVLNEASRVENTQFEAISYLNLSDVQLKRCEWKRAVYYTDKAINLTYINQKWNLYANGNVIKARALFALGEYDNAIDILLGLKKDPKVMENLLQYQEILAWLLHFHAVYEPEKAYEIVGETDLNISTMHEILRRELFFINFSRRRYLQAAAFLRELDEVAILKAFFDSDVELLVRQLKEIKAQSEMDSYLYYLVHFIRHFPKTAFSGLAEEIQEAVNLYTYKPVSYLLENNDILAQPSTYWNGLLDKLSGLTDQTAIAELILSNMQRLIKAEKFVYLDLQKGRPVPISGIDEDGNRCTMDNLLLSRQLLSLISEKEGYFYLHPVLDHMESDAHSSVLGLGINTACGYVIRRNGQPRGIFYCDSTRQIIIDENSRAVCKILFFIAQAALDSIFSAQESQDRAELSDLDEDIAAQTIIGKSEVMREVYAKISLVAGHNVNVLITGPTGSGKELVAREIHRQYITKNQAGQKTPFIAVNCAAIPEQLLESELFGYRKGAFTGAAMDKKGKLLLADNGTIFLDEIGEMPLLLQSKLLRAIQEKVITPLGSDQDIPVNVRIIAASNRNLEEMVSQNSFRADLFYRLKVMTIDLPPLSERKDDIPLLAVAFLTKFNDKFRKKIKGIHPSTVSYLQQRDWKGNVRELENEMERAVLLCDREYLTMEDFNAEPDTAAGSIFRSLPLKWQQFKDYKKRIESELEKRYIKLLLDEAEDNVTKASQIGNLDRMQIYRLMGKKKVSS